MSSPADTLVCVTGASGYIASHVVRVLLERGHRVRGTVRDASDPRRIDHLRRIAERADAADRLELVEADLLRDGSFDAAVEGARWVAHMAAVVRFSAKDPAEIVDPALEGTKNVLGSIARASVERVVMTSSVAAVSDDVRPESYVFTDEDWNESADRNKSPYHYAKTESERAAWDWAERQGDAGPSLVCINPAFVFGPLYVSGHRRSSPAVLRDLMSGAFPAIPNFMPTLVDVRDVAEGHVRALEDESAKGRYIMANETLSIPEIAEMVRPEFPRAKIPRFVAPAPFWYAVALVEKRLSWAFLKRNLNVAKQYDGTRITKELGVSYRPVRTTVLDTAQSFYDVKALRT
jgi:dihydroflavonol-4-reductase